MKAFQKKNHLIVAAVFIAIVVGALVIQSCTRETSAYKVGGVFTLTGGTAYWSEQLQKGIELALQEENKAGEIPIKVIYEDVQGQGQIAASAFQKLSDIEKVSIIVSVFTPVSQPLRPIAEQTRIPLLATVV